MKDYAVSNRALDLAARRAALRAYCEIQRNHLAATTRDIEARLAGVDRVIDTVQNFAHRPLLVLSVMGALGAVGPRRLFRWASRGAFLLTTVQRLRRFIRK